MKILHFTDPIEFLNRTRELLLENETENNLPLGILASILAGEFLEKPPYLSLVEEGELRLAMICTPPYPVLFTYHASPIPTKILEAVLADLAEKLGENFTGITGNKTLTAKLARIWQDISPGEAELKMAMRIYRLDQVDPVSGVPGRLRSVEYRDKALLLEWFTNFHRDGLGGEPDPGPGGKTGGQILKRFTRTAGADVVGSARSAGFDGWLQRTHAQRDQDRGGFHSQRAAEERICQRLYRWIESGIA